MDNHTNIESPQWQREPQPQPQCVVGLVASVFADVPVALSVDVAVGYQRPVAVVGDMQDSDCSAASCWRCC